jgi:hypothetical protein
MSHSPAPWTVSPDPEWPAEAFSVNGKDHMEIAGRIGKQGDARLIAAAPELLAALEACREVCNALAQKGSVFAREAVTAADAAIAKAKGEQ